MNEDRSKPFPPDVEVTGRVNLSVHDSAILSFSVDEPRESPKHWLKRIARWAELALTVREVLDWLSQLIGRTKIAEAVDTAGR